jgi:hypothetical protein
MAARLQFGPKRLDESRDADDLPEEDTIPSDATDDVPF